jgi:hypothetical protein
MEWLCSLHLLQFIFYFLYTVPLQSLQKHFTYVPVSRYINTLNINLLERAHNYFNNKACVGLIMKYAKTSVTKTDAHVSNIKMYFRKTDYELDWTGM